MMSSQLRTSMALAIIFGIYAASAALTVGLVSSLYGFSCAQSFFTVNCAFPPDSAQVGPNYAVLALFLLVVSLVAVLKWRRAAAYPFFMLSAALCGAALLWDLVAQQPVIHGPKITNDTINILRAVIAASFVLLIILCRGQSYTLSRLSASVATSYALTGLSVIGFVELSESVFGVTELFLLYVMYAFGSFSLHLMTVCGFVAALGTRISAEGASA